MFLPLTEAQYCGPAISETTRLWFCEYQDHTIVVMLLEEIKIVVLKIAKQQYFLGVLVIR